ncbi:hypothetical protein Nepgr_025118 [Nepenthes gracilis]|uniref:Clp R domain-containing protein n=1 Tax=Nepenthes gracilis TaxID=150966 RepID=A0AAD3T584_NEPGR|nr:hypothetical protein Nepgr_025118 [Nepenthes gracilis]
MRTGLSTIQQTLAQEAGNVLNQSIAEASRRSHGQTTPLHVAATLLASPSGYLRQACIRSHPKSSHPLQCRALELCFSVALERLPTAQTPNVAPPISNALMAALKRAQAHQRRGCPEQQQQPLLAVKIELEQLIISILDDPSVSRVMREASFSSPAVKAAIEQSLGSQTNSASVCRIPKIGLGFKPSAQPASIPAVSGSSLYLNPRLQQQGNAMQSGQQRAEEVKKIIGILSRTKKRNPVLIGESEPEAVLREVLRRIEKKEVGDGPLENVEVISMEKELTSARSQVSTKIKELVCLIEGRMMSSNGGGTILDLGDLKWLVDQPPNFRIPVSGNSPHQGASEDGRAAVAEMGKIWMKFGSCDGGSGRLWLIGTATCETYLRCQVYHPTMENDWDLQAVSIAARAPFPGLSPRLGPNGILSSSIESLNSFKSSPAAGPTLIKSVPRSPSLSQRLSCCPQCSENFELELAKLKSEQEDKSTSEFKSDATQQLLPLWLRNAKVHNADLRGMTDLSQSKNQDLILKQKSEELQKQWTDTCLRLHPSFHHKPITFETTIPEPFSVAASHNSNPIGCQKLQQTGNLGDDLQLDITSGSLTCHPQSPIGTDLALGQTKMAESIANKSPKELIDDIHGCISSESHNKFINLQREKPLAAAEIDSFKKLLKGLKEKVWWQKEAASAVAAAVTHCRTSNGKHRVAGAKGDIWLLFSGPDRIGKKKMADALSELVCCVNPVTICLGSCQDGKESESNFRGKTILDRIAEAVRRNPFSVVVLQDIDEADTLICGSIKRAIERGRLADSHGREISLGNVIFILTASRVPGSFKNSCSRLLLSNEKLASLAGGSWQLKLSIGKKMGKRHAHWLNDEYRTTKPRKEMGASALSFDLNETADTEDDRLDGSRNSSDLTVDHEVENGHENWQSPGISSASHELLDSVDDAIIFKPVDFAVIWCHIEREIMTKFSTIIGNKLDLKVEEAALQKILGGLWHGQTGLEAWLEKVLVPAIEQLKTSLPASMDETWTACLELDGESENRSHGDWLPNRITIDTVDWQ